MIPLNTGYRLPGQMSAEFSALRRQLPGGGYGAPADALGPISALQELELIAGRGFINSRDAESLKVDVREALNDLGARTREAARLEIDGFLRGMGDLRKRIADPASRASLRAEVDTVLARLSDDDVRSAAWRDAAGEFLRSDRSAERCELRLLQLRELAEHAGFDWQYLSGQLDFVLEDRRVVIASLLPEVPEEGEEIAGLTEQARLDLCASRVAEGVGRIDAAVWFVIAHEAMNVPWISLGPVQFFTGGLWHEGLLPGGELSVHEPDFVPPPELADVSDAEAWMQRIDRSQVLLARIWLTDVPRGRAETQAREVLEASIELAHPDSSWEVYEGALAWTLAGGWFGRSFLSPTEARKHAAPVHPVFEPTAENLQDLDVRLIERLASQEKETASAVHDTRLDLAIARNQSPELRVALGTRPIERALSASASQERKWVKVAADYLLAPWIKYTLYDELFDAARSGLAVPEYQAVSPQQEKEFSRLDALIWCPERPGRRLFSLAGFRQAAADLLSAVDDEGTAAHRLVSAAAEILASHITAAERLDQLQLRFHRLLVRSERQRNTIIHGGLPPAGLLANVDAFLRTLGAYAAQDALRHTQPGEVPLERLKREREEFLEAMSAIEAGGNLIDCLFPEELVSPG
jgi:hypothetical protein